jgi:hypothetical protein
LWHCRSPDFHSFNGTAFERFFEGFRIDDAFEVLLVLLDDKTDSGGYPHSQLSMSQHTHQETSSP